MQRNKVKVGEVYAYSRGRDGGWRSATPVRVTNLEGDVPMYRYGRKTGETQKSIVGLALDSKTLEPIDDYLVTIEPRNLWRLWSEQIVVDAEREKQFMAERERREQALAAQEAAFAEVRRIVGEDALRKATFSKYSGDVAEMSALTLLAIVEAARDSQADR